MKRGFQAGLDERRGFNLKMFSTDELEEIHYSTLEVMETIGIQVFCDDAMDILEGAGAEVDRNTNTVRFPQWMVEDAIRSAPKKIMLAGRDPKHDMIMEGRRVGFTNFGAGVMIVDPYTGEPRETTKKDVALTALVCDAVDSVDIYSSAVVARDMPEASVDLHEAEAFLSNTTKHCQHIDLTGGAGARGFLEMAAAIVGGYEELRRRPVVSALVCPVSPLQLHTNTCEVIIEFAKAGVPVNVLSMAMSGASSPITLAGTLVTHNAEVLAGIVLAQATRKGTPIMYGSSTTTFDLTYVTAPVGAPELGMINAGVAELSNFYRLPSYVAGT